MQVAQQLDWLSEEAVRSKLLPLLMQWDLCHPHEVCCHPCMCCKQATENRLVSYQHQGSSTPHDCREQHQLCYLVLPAVPFTPACHAFGGVL